MKKCKYNKTVQGFMGDFYNRCVKKDILIHLRIVEKIIDTEQGTIAIMGKGTCDGCKDFVEDSNT